MLKRVDAVERVAHHAATKLVALVLQARRERLQTSLDVFARVVGHGDRVFEHGTNEIRDRDPQGLGDPFELAFEHGRNTRVKHALLSARAIITFALVACLAIPVKTRRVLVVITLPAPRIEDLCHAVIRTA